VAVVRVSPKSVIPDATMWRVKMGVRCPIVSPLYPVLRPRPNASVWYGTNNDRALNSLKATGRLTTKTQVAIGYDRR
jgi:hypothetical protein